MRHRRSRCAVAVGLAAAVTTPLVAGAASNHAITTSAANASASWPMGGQNTANTRSNPAETAIGADNAQRLAVKWTFTTHGDVSATPAVVDGAVYFPDWGGYLYRLDAKTGRALWTHKISEYVGIDAAVSRTSPTVVNGTVYVGDQNGAHLIAVDAATGDLRWVRQLDTHPLAALTQSPVVDDGVVYEGVSSNEEAYSALIPGYVCCTFRGSMNAVSALTGAVLWRTPMTPDGYSGAAVWGSTSALDPSTRTLYIGSGNNYTVPASAKECEENGGTPAECLSPDDHFDAVLALNMDTGAIKWSLGAVGFDDWSAGCIPGFGFPNNRPVDPGPDFDFGSGPNLFTIKGAKNSTRKVVGVGQKSGQYWTLDAATGEVLWSTAAGPGSALGGIEWGTATDGKRIYVAESNFDRLPYTTPNGQTINTGSFAALDPVTGKVLWQTPDPSGSFDLGALSTANGVVYAPSMSGHMYALDASNGRVLWDYQGAGSSNVGAAIVDGTVYWGNGYSRLPFPGFNQSTTFYAFALRNR
jgi:polyvinyl alcohol dehydrogenase (cytochrome)